MCDWRWCPPIYISLVLERDLRENGGYTLATKSVNGSNEGRKHYTYILLLNPTLEAGFGQLL